MVSKEILSIQKYLKANKLVAFIVPSFDAHQSEYVADYWKCRAYASGFDGSAATLVVTQTEAALWTDSRYFLQADAQLKGSSIMVMKEGLEGVLAPAEWLKSKFSKGRVGVDALLYTENSFAAMRGSLEPLELVAEGDIFTQLWASRPELPCGKAFYFKPEFSGKTTADKLSELRARLALKDKESYIITALDEIAWLLNIRGSDIEYNPVAIAYLIVGGTNSRLYINSSKLSASDAALLAADKVRIKPYEAFSERLSKLKGRKVIYNPNKLSHFHAQLLKEGGAIMVPEQDGSGMVCSLKAIKNRVEIDGFRTAVVEDGIALTRFFIWLEESLYANNTVVSELSVVEKLHNLRQESPIFRGDSFATICGYKSNGAIVHYNVTPKSSRRITADGFLLIDSGGQYICGTTDITRTVHLGKPSEQERQDFTNVLKGHIDLSMAIFPEGTRGSQLDFLARQYLCANSLNYMHGTGHGVGHFLNVHEGPQSIRQSENPVTIKPGMVTTNEPGLYRSRKYGIRIENMILAVSHASSGSFMGFETLTLFPIDRKCIEVSMLLPMQRRWINKYHALVYDTLSPRLSPKEKTWLLSKTKVI